MGTMAGFLRNVLFFCTGILLVFQLYNNGNNLNGMSTNDDDDDVDEQLQPNGMEMNQKKFDNNSMLSNDANAKSRNRRDFLIRFKNIRLKYRMEFASPCPTQTKLIMLSMARRDGYEKRQGVRQTWMNDSIPGEVIRFLVAEKSQNEANGTQQKLEEEQTKFGDLVFLSGFEDKYKHIHLKWYAGLQWQQAFCAHAEWVMKADDDSVIHLRRLAHWTDKKFRPIAAQHPLVYFGQMLIHPSPIRNPNNKWYVTEEVYPLDWYPNFMQGTVYLTTSATIRAILLRAREIDGFYLDDVVFTGILGELANVTMSDHKNHFKGNLRLDERNVECVNGTPTAIAMYGLQIMKDYEYHYAKLKSINCTKNK